MYNNSNTRYQSNNEITLYDIEKHHYKVRHVHNSYHIMSFWSETNPAICRLNDEFKNISSMEVTKICIPRSENTCEYYRNCAFISLFNNFQDIIEQNNTSDIFMADIGITDYNYDSFIIQLNNATSQSIDLLTKINFKYDCLPSHTIKESIGTVPYILESITYSITSLISALNEISTMNNDMYSTNVPLITTAYNTDTKKLFFYATEQFYMIPANAYQVLGLSPYKVYISQYNTKTNTYIVNADLSPMLRGAPCLYVKNDESTLLRPNCFNTCLCSYVFDDENDTKQSIYVTSSMKLAVTMQTNTINKFTFRLYSDIENKILYQTHNCKWYIELCIYGT